MDISNCKETFGWNKSFEVYVDKVHCKVSHVMVNWYMLETSSRKSMSFMW